MFFLPHLFRQCVWKDWPGVIRAFKDTQANMAKFEKIVDMQRKILAEEINPDITKIQQLCRITKNYRKFRRD